MRVIIYVPDSRTADRTRRSVERDVKRQGHDVVGYAVTAPEAHAAIDTGIADKVAGRPEHLFELVPWALSVPRPRNAVPALGAAVLAAGGWLVAGRRRRWVAAGAAAAVAATVAAYVMQPGEVDVDPPLAAPPPPATEPTAPTQGPEGAPTPAQPGTQEAVATSRPPGAVPPSSPPPGSATSTPPTQAGPTTGPPGPTSTPSATSTPGCLLTLGVDLLGRLVVIDLCVGRTSG